MFKFFKNRCDQPKIDEIQSQNIALKSQLNETKVLLEKKENIIFELKTNLKEVNDYLDAELKKQKNTIASHSDAIEIYEKKHNETIFQHEEQLNALCFKVSSLNLENEKLSNEISKLKKDYESGCCENKKILELKQEINAVCRANDRLRKEVEFAEHKVNKQIKAGNEFRVSFKKAELINEQLSNQIKTLNDFIEKQGFEIDEYKSVIQNGFAVDVDFDLIRERTRLINREKSNEQLIDELKNTINKLNSQQAGVDFVHNEEVRALKKDLNNLHGRIKESHDVNEHLKLRLTKSNEENLGLKQEILLLKKNTEMVYPTTSNNHQKNNDTINSNNKNKLDALGIKETTPNKTNDNHSSLKNNNYFPIGFIDTPIRVKGVSYSNPDGTSRQNIIEHAKVNSHVFLIRDLNNQHDPNAIKVITKDGCIGFIPKELAAQLRTVNIESITAKIDSIGKGEQGLYGCSIVIKNS